jgi:hypothetical protein
MTPNMATFSRALLHLRDSSLGIIIPMPHSIDFSSLEKAVIDEELWPAGSSSEIDDDTASTMLLGVPKEKSYDDYSFSRSPLFFIIDLFLIVAVFVLVQRSPTSEAPIDVQLGGDIAGYVPRFSQKIVRFKSYPEFVSNHSSEASLEEARKHWMQLLPRTCRKISSFPSR